MRILTRKSYLRNIIVSGVLVFGILSLSTSCNHDILNETPLSSLSAKATLNSKEGFETYLIGLVRSAREEMTQDDNTYFITNWPGTDIGADAGEEYYTYRNWVSYLNPNTPEVKTNWDWAYKEMISQANTIITYANKPELQKIWANDQEKNAVIAEAKFFRAYTYNFLANLYGGVPIVDTLQSQPRFDYVRAKRSAVYSFAQKDLEFAVKWLPETVPANKEGSIVKAAAEYLLTNVDISLGQYEKAIESASTVINSGNYHLMTKRFGSKANEPGDVFSDLFQDGNYNRSSGNMESIYVWQFAENIAGGGGTRGGNATIRNIGPFLTKIKDPDGVADIPTDTLGRGVGRVRGTNYSIYDIWKNDEDDIRNSKYNFRRKFYFNNPASKYYGQLIKNVINLSKEDTSRRLYAYPRKIEGNPWEGDNASGRTTNDVYVYRLAGLYLLRAEAYLRNGEKQKAADDINKVRSRAHASSISASDVSVDFILDERARELMYEVSRRRTLMRMGKLVERVRKYGFPEVTRETIQDYDSLWPIPQDAIDANFAKKLEQNPGY